jgi:type VI secretion system protein ImpA
VWQTELKRADWGAVEFLCSTALAERSKDLQLAAWLLEAWIQLDGFEGAARGLELIARLCMAFWDGMYPSLTEELEARLAPVRWIIVAGSPSVRTPTVTLGHASLPIRWQIGSRLCATRTRQRMAQIALL